MALERYTISGTNLDIGTPVYDVNGEKLGELKDLTESYFKVDVRMAPDYWLPVHLIEDAGSEGIRLACTEDQLDEHRVSTEAIEEDPREFEPSEDGRADTAHPEAMERRYDAQAEYLTHPHPPT
jgi:hypothetical protein